MRQKKTGIAEAWNFGPEDSDARTVGWIADALTRAWGDGARWETDNADHPHENTYLKLDSSKAKAFLGWHPRLSLNQALNWIVEWFQELDSKGDMRAHTLRDIERYMALVEK